MSDAFLLVTATDLDDWSRRQEARSKFAQVIRKLIATTVGVGNIVKIEFRADEGTQLGGPDGTLVAKASDDPVVAVGESLWELGTDRNIKGKADGDYEKRVADTPALNRSGTTFVFATTRRWASKNKWAEGRKKEGAWKDVVALDADDLEAWLERTPAVHVWLSCLIGKAPRGADDLSSFGDAWMDVTNPALTPEFIVAGRQDQVAELTRWAQGQPGAIAVRGETSEEAVAFFFAALEGLPELEHDRVLALAVVVSDPVAWKALKASGRGLIMIPTFADRSQALSAVSSGHHVLIPLGRNEPRVGNTVDLARPHRRESVEILKKMGIGEERVGRLASMGRGSLGAVRRALARHPAALIPAWASSHAGRELLPALFAGRWDESSAADQAILEKLSGRKYPEYREVVARWAAQPDPPVRQIGAKWVMVAKGDAWTLLSPFLTDQDLLRLEEAVTTACIEPDPKFDMPVADRMMAAVHGKVTKHSAYLREGLADTLALIGSIAEPSLAQSHAPQDWANRVVQNLLAKATTWQSWAALGGQLRALAEAAPVPFLDGVELGLSGSDPILAGLFVDGDPMFSSSPHTELLWALEVLCWPPEHLARASLTLARLAAIDPGGRLGNRPLATLRSVFLPWCPNTSADPDRRARILNMLCTRESKVSWNLLCELLPKHSDSSHPTARPRHRDWAPDVERRVKMSELYAMTQKVVGLALEQVGTDGSRWQKVIETFDDVPDALFEECVTTLSSIDPQALKNEDQLAVWGSLRELLARHRRFPEADWALPSEKLDRIDALYAKFEPRDALHQVSWLFSNRVELPLKESFDWQETERRLSEMQRQAVGRILAASGLEAVLKLGASAERAFQLGVALGHFPLNQDDEDRTLTTTLASSTPSMRSLGFGFIEGRVTFLGEQWRTALRSSAAWQTYSSAQRADYFLTLPFAPETWTMIADDAELDRLYWTQVGTTGRGALPAAHRYQAAATLIRHGQHITAMDLLTVYSGSNHGPIPAALAQEVLEGIADGKCSQPLERLGSMGAYNMSQLLDVVASQRGHGNPAVIRLEWYFLPLLRHDRPPKALHQALANEPTFFVEILKLLYKPKHGTEPPPTEEQGRRAEIAYGLLHDWKTMPGSQSDGTIDWARFDQWIAAARRLAADADRMDVADLHIGNVLAHCPAEPGGDWPAVPARDFLERIANEKIEQGIRLGIYNSRGVTTRAFGAGGEQERDTATRYRSIAGRLVDEWPRTARVLKTLADGYVADARYEDIRAEMDEELWS
ncbi:MAG: hypothetical protein JXQ75_12585 [Phycisphaerae bacterium]|nr:hypothetical protein [Phycisphaerae bacterium]